jgi:hypothetical protein
MKSQSLLTTVAIAALIPSIAAADSGLFIAGNIGKAELSENFDGFDVDTDSTAYRFTAGWRFNNYVALEAGYQNFGSFGQTFNDAGESVSISLKADGFTIGGIANLPISDRYSLFARAGAFFWDGDGEINNTTAAKPEDTNFYFGAGLQLRLTDQLAVTADGSHYDLDSTSSTVVSVGLYYRF